MDKNFLILVTGATGLLGSSLCPYLKECGHEVLRQSRYSESGVEVVADLADYHKLKNKLAEIQPDIIINLTAITNVDYCEKNPSAAYRANTLIVENLARWVKNGNNKTHLMQVSTDHVYDGPGPHSEEDVRLTNYYAYSKYAGELAATYAGATILRTNFFGISRCPGRKTFSDWLINAFKSKSRITLFDDVWFSPLEIKSLAEYIEHAARSKRPGIYNLGSRNGLTKADFAEKLAGEAGLTMGDTNKKSVAEMALAAYRPRDMRMNIRKYERTFKVELPDLIHEIEKTGKMYCHGTK